MHIFFPIVMRLKITTKCGVQLIGCDFYVKKWFNGGNLYMTS